MPPLWSVICNYAYCKDTDIFIKGDSTDKEEYSIFDNLESLSVISDILLDFESDAGDVNMANSYYLDELEEMPSRTPIANGNLQARCRMKNMIFIQYKSLRIRWG